jgi:class 3 adenylate cyclase
MPQESKRRQAPLDKLLFGLLLPAWLICFGLGLPSMLRPPLYPHFGVRADESGGPPVVIDVSPQVNVDLRPGDRIVQIGAVDLRGAGQLQFYAHYLALSRGTEPPLIVYERAGVRGQITGPTVGSDSTTQRALRAVSVGFLLVSLLLSIRAPPLPFGRLASRGFLLWAIHSTMPITGGVAMNYAGLALTYVFTSLAFPVCLKAVLRFPRGAPLSSSWARYGPWLFAVAGPLNANVTAGFPFPFPIGIALFFATSVTYMVAIVVRIGLTYRGENPVGRRQIRWVVLGFYAAIAPSLTLMGLELLDQLFFEGWRHFYPWVLPSLVFLVLIPISFLIAIVGYNLFDVDRLLSATASYNAVLVVLVGIGLLVVPWFGELSSAWLGLDPRVGQAAFSLALAAFVVPAQQRLRPRIEGLFFKERHALDQGIGELLHSLSSCETARALTERVGEELTRLLRPEACVVYARAGEAFAPIFAEGRGVPPAFEAESLLVAALAKREKPLAVSAAGRTPDAAPLGPFDRAALESLEAEVVVPVRREDALLAFLCLGPKRSGDVYTSTDLSHLGSLAEAVSSQLRRFDQEQVIREARAMQESLRRYVPGAIAEQLASGIELGSAEREVTVLFVDIRGYTRFSESRRAVDIFSTVNRYTETVSTIVREHGGAVVEFNGDGMMAVFGAPRSLAQKERAAVSAGRETFAAVAALPFNDAKGDSTRLSVGVGIATGEAFVGNIRAADRLIWSAIGNTTNLAARLQGLSRDLEASLVIDATTYGALDEARSDLVRHAAFEIRGRREPEDLYTLPLPRAVQTR